MSKATNIYAQQQINKVAVISFFTSKQIDASEVSGIATLIAKISKDPSLNLDSAMSMFYGSWKNDFQAKFPFEFIAEPTVVNNPQYPTLMDGSTQFYSPEYVLTPDSLKYIPINGIAPFRNTDAIKKSFEVIKEADAVMVVFLSFSIMKKTEIYGFGTAKVRAYANIQLFDKASDPLLKLKEAAVSTNSFQYALGGAILDVADIQPLCMEATKNLLLDLNKTLPSKLEKLKKKLGK